MAEAKGHYEQVGDIQEWVWDVAPEWKVARGEFDPKAVEPAPKAAPKAEPKAAVKR